MQRFKVFAGSQQSSSEEEDRDEDEDENEDQDQDEEEEEEDKPATNEEVEEERTSEKDHTTFQEVTIKVDLPEEEKVDASYADSGYWKVSGCAEDLDDLLADYE